MEFTLVGFYQFSGGRMDDVPKFRENGRDKKKKDY